MAAANRTGGLASQQRTAYFCPSTYLVLCIVLVEQAASTYVTHAYYRTHVF